MMRMTQAKKCLQIIIEIKHNNLFTALIIHHHMINHHKNNNGDQQSRLI